MILCAGKSVCGLYGCFPVFVYTWFTIYGASYCIHANPLLLPFHSIDSSIDQGNTDEQCCTKVSYQRFNGMFDMQRAPRGCFLSNKRVSKSVDCSQEVWQIVKHQSEPKFSVRPSLVHSLSASIRRSGLHSKHRCALVRQHLNGSGYSLLDSPANVAAVELAAPVQNIPDDDYFMGMAIQEAERGSINGEVPVGAVLVLDDKVVASAHNETHNSRNPIAHAELLCIMRAASQLDAWRLLQATLYVTIEPCPMCAGAILQSRIKRLVYGAPQPRLGADGSWIAMFPDSPMQLRATNTDAFKECSADETDADSCMAPVSCQSEELMGTAQLSPQAACSRRQQTDGMLVSTTHPSHPVQPFGPHPFHNSITVTRGVRSSECAEIMIQFFRRRRLEAALQNQDAQAVLPPDMPLEQPGTSAQPVASDSSQWPGAA